MVVEDIVCGELCGLLWIVFVCDEWIVYVVIVYFFFIFVVDVVLNFDWCEVWFGLLVGF